MRTLRLTRLLAQLTTALCWIVAIVITGAGMPWLRSGTPVARAISTCPGAISFGDTIECTIQVSNEKDAYTFNASAGDRILMRVARTTGTLRPRISVLDFNNTYLCGNYALMSAEAECTIGTTGAFTLLIDDAYNAQTGGYMLYVQRLNNPGTPIGTSYGQTNTGTIAYAASAVTYQFAASAGDKILARMVSLSSALTPRLSVYGPSGSYVCGNYAPGVTEAECTLVTSGLYTVLALDTLFVNTGSFNLYVQRLNQPSNVLTLEYGVPVTGTISSPAQANTYHFTGTSGQRLLGEMNRTSGMLGPRITIFDPQGTFVCGNYGETSSVIDCVLPVDGTYVLQADDTFRNGTGTYSLEINCPNQSCAAPPAGTERLFIPLVRR